MTDNVNEGIETQQESFPVSDTPTNKQLNFIMKLQDELHDFMTAESFLKDKHKENIRDLPKREASELIDRLLARKEAIK